MAIPQPRHSGHRSDADDWLIAIRERFDVLAQLGSDWNSYGATPPADAAMAAALRFIIEVVHENRPTVWERVLPTSISPLPSGGIEMEWRNATDLIAIDVGPDGEWGFLRRAGTGRDARYEEGEDVPRDGLLPMVAEVLDLPRVM